MAVGIASAFVNSILNGICNNTDPSNLPVAVFAIQLHVGDPGAAGTSNQAGNDTRKAVSFSNASAPLCTNDTAISWTGGEVDTSEDYTHWSAWTSATTGAGSFICSGVMTANAVVTADLFSIPIGELDLTLTTAS